MTPSVIGSFFPALAARDRVNYVSENNDFRSTWNTMQYSVIETKKYFSIWEKIPLNFRKFVV
jgi:hypothetical protein